MSFEDLENPFVGGDAVRALVGEDLDGYAVTDLEARIATLEAEIERSRQAIKSKSSQRDAAEALFNFKT